MARSRRYAPLSFGFRSRVGERSGEIGPPWLNNRFRLSEAETPRDNRMAIKEIQMAERKQFQSKLTVKPELRRLLAEARTKEVSEDELHEQRVSFAFGNAPESAHITKDSVRYAKMFKETATVDGQGRILLPQNVREVCELNGAVAVVDMEIYIEVWCKESMMKRYADLVRAFKNANDRTF